MAISPQLPEHNGEMVEKWKLSFPVLSDRGNRVARDFGLVWQLPEELRAVYQELGTDLTEYNGDDSWTLPMPGRYVVRPDGVIHHAEVSPDYTRRPEPEDTLAVVRRLTA